MTTSFIPVPYPESVVWYAVTSPLAGCLPTTTAVLPQSPVYQLETKSLKWTGQTETRLPKADTSKHFHVFVGDLGADVDTHHLHEAFAPFGQISDCKIIRDPQTMKSRGYGFVTFVQKNEAETAIALMNGRRVGSRPVRTNWAVRKPPASGPLTGQPDGIQKPLTFEEVYSQTSPTNSTVYCGGVLTDLTDEVMHQTFQAFGSIQEIRTFKEKGYAFIRFSSKEMAAQAIVATNGAKINGHVVRCAWGKEPLTEGSCSPATSPVQTSVTLAVPSNYGVHNENVYNQTGLWPQTLQATQPAGQYQTPQQPGSYIGQPCLQHGYALTTYSGSVPAAQWAAQFGLGPAQQVTPQFLAQPPQQQPCFLSFPMQQRA